VFLDYEAPRFGLASGTAGGFGGFVKMPFLPVLCEFFHPVYVTNTVSKSAAQSSLGIRPTANWRAREPSPFAYSRVLVTAQSCGVDQFAISLLTGLDRIKAAPRENSLTRRPNLSPHPDSLGP